jgi:hypothetical protein
MRCLITQLSAKRFRRAVTCNNLYPRGAQILGAPLFKNLQQGSRLRTQITQLRYLTPDVALIQARAAVTRQARRWSRRADRVNTSIAVRAGDGWLLAASHNTTHRRFAEKAMGELISREFPAMRKARNA